MNFIWEKITEWLKNLLVGGIISNLTGMFDSINDQVADVAAVVGATPQGWNASVFNMVKSLSENVIIPIAGLILTFVMTYELIQMIIERNNMAEFETFNFFKWIMKTFCAVMIVTNTWNIVMGIFEVAQTVVNNAAGVIIADTAIDLESVITNIEDRLMEMDVGTLFGLWFQTMLISIVSWALTICIFVVVYGFWKETSRAVLTTSATNGCCKTSRWIKRYWASGCAAGLLKRTSSFLPPREPHRAAPSLQRS